MRLNPNGWLFAYSIGLVGSMLCSSSAYAIDFCKNLNSSRDLVNCSAILNFNSVERESRKNSLKLKENASGLKPNPEFEADFWSGNQDGENTNELSVSWKHLWTRGNKLEKEKQAARVTYEIAQAEYDLELSLAKKESITHLYSIRTLSEQIKVVEEMVESYERIVKTYRNRQALSPQNRISVQVFAMAKHEAKAQLEVIKDQLAIHRNHFIKIGLTSQTIKRFLPKNWPNWDQFKKTPLKVVSNLNQRLRERNLSKISLDLEKEKSNSYQDIKIGPMVSISQEASNSNLHLGVSFSMDLPIYNQNRQMIAFANSKWKNQQDLIVISKEQDRIEMKSLQDRYSKLLRTFQAMPSLNWIENAHRDVEAEARRGFIDASLIIEAHNQYLGLIERRNEIKIQMLKLLTEIHLISDRDVSEVIP